VVCKLSTNGRIYLTQHWDARPNKKTEDQEPREETIITPAKLKNLGPEVGVPPHKVRVGPLGNLQRLAED
jgi:hypothetical protein